MPDWTSNLSPGGAFMSVRLNPTASPPSVTAGDSLAVGATVTERGDGIFVVQGDGELRIDGEFSATGVFSFEVFELDAAGAPTGSAATVHVGAITADERFSATFTVGSSQAYKPISSVTCNVKRLFIAEINQ